MDVVSCHVEILSRAKGRSAVQMAAYCAREKLANEYNGKLYDHTERGDLVYQTILLPYYAPKKFRNREVLWNAVEQIEKSKNAQLARTVMLALPKELNQETHIEMVCQYVKEQFVSRGMCADVSIHDKGDGNPHVHIMLTTRSLYKDGSWMPKQLRNYLLDEDGNRIRDPKTQKYLLGKSIKANDWDDRSRIEEWRKAWAEICNQQYALHGKDKRVSHKSYARQGVDRIPTKHLGARVKALSDRGIMTDRMRENIKIDEINRQKARQRMRESLERNYTPSKDYERSII